jgi:CheY-like chemotaxis protein
MEPGIKRVLMVDDERAFLRGISAWLKTQGGLEVATAVNGVEAVEVLESSQVDLVVTDLQMPVMDGFALLAHMNRHHPTIPVMVMTAYATPAALERMAQLGSVTCLEKPLVMEDFFTKVRETLHGPTRGYLQGISVTSILQLLEMERKTAALTISSGEQRGSMFFLDGRLIDAQTSQHRGDDAAMEIISWDEGRIEIDTARQSPRKTVTSGLHFLIMESLRLKDEGGFAESGELFHGSDAPQEAADELGELTAEDPMGEAASPHTASERAALQETLAPLGGINGFSAVAVMSPSGEVIVSRTMETREDFDAEAVAFAEIARAAHETAARHGLEGCSEITMGTKKNLVLVQSPEIDGAVPFRVVAMLRWDCDQALLAARFGEVVPALMRALSAKG